MADNFGIQLRTIRDSMGLSQEELADLLGTSKQVISRYENSQRTPKITVAKEYADILNVELNYLLGIESTKKAPSAPKEQIRLLLEQELNRNITIEQVDAFLALFRTLSDNNE